MYYICTVFILIYMGAFSQRVNKVFNTKRLGMEEKVYTFKTKDPNDKDKVIEYSLRESELTTKEIDVIAVNIMNTIGQIPPAAQVRVAQWLSSNVFEYVNKLFFPDKEIIEPEEGNNQKDTPQMKVVKNEEVKEEVIK